MSTYTNVYALLLLKYILCSIFVQLRTCKLVLFVGKIQEKTSLFQDTSSEDCKQSKGMQTRSFLNDHDEQKTRRTATQFTLRNCQSKYSVNRLTAFEAVVERRAIYKLNAHFFYRKFGNNVNTFCINTIDIYK